VIERGLLSLVCDEAPAFLQSASESGQLHFRRMRFPSVPAALAAIALCQPVLAQEAPAAPTPAASAPVAQPLARVRPVSVRPGDEAYPEALHSKGVQGVVEVLVTLGSDGKPTEASVASGSRSQALDAAGLALVKGLQFGVKAPAEGASSPAVPNATRVLVPVAFLRDSLSTLGKKTCAEFVVDVDYHRATFPEQQVADMSVITMTTGALVMGGFQRSGPDKLVALAKKAKAAGRDIAWACAAAPERLFLQQFKELMEKSGV
jgi:TonB family protein